MPDLYIKQKRYDDALKILRKIKKPEYAEKKRSYIERVTSLKEKAQIRSKNEEAAPIGAKGGAYGFDNQNNLGPGCLRLGRGE